MGIAYDYIARRHSQAYADAIELDRVCTEISGMESKLETLAENLAGARQYASVLTASIANAQQLVEDTCKREGWPLPEPPAEPPAPAPIGDGITRETTHTLAFEAVRVANPLNVDAEVLVCGHEDCGQELVRTDGGVYVHTRSGRAMCKPEPAESGGIQWGTDGSPLLTTVLPPHGVEVTRDDA